MRSNMDAAGEACASTGRRTPLASAARPVTCKNRRREIAVIQYGSARLVGVAGVRRCDARCALSIARGARFILCGVQPREGGAGTCCVSPAPKFGIRVAEREVHSSILRKGPLSGLKLGHGLGRLADIYIQQAENVMREWQFGIQLHRLFGVRNASG